MIIQLNFEKFDSETSKLQSVNLSETPGDTAGVHQRAADSLQSFQPDPSSVMTD